MIEQAEREHAEGEARDGDFLVFVGGTNQVPIEEFFEIPLLLDPVPKVITLSHQQVMTFLIPTRK